MKITTVLILLILLSALSGCISSDKSQADLLEPRENSEAGIKITVTYLPDTGGKTYKPLSYEGSKGHHASGILRFPKIEGKKFELVIQDVAGVKERVFKW